MTTLVALLLAAAGGPVLAQDSGAQASPAAPAAASCTPEHAAMGHCTLPSVAAQPPVASCTAEHAAMGHCTLPPAAAQPPVASCTAEHAAMGHCSLPAASPPPAKPGPAPAASCTPEHAAMGHCTPPSAPAQPMSVPAARQACAPEHAAMGHCVSAADEPPVAPPPPAALSGPENAADAVFGAGPMALARETLRREHGDAHAYKILFDRVEARLADQGDGYLIDGQAWYGGDIDKLWLKSEVEGDFDAGIEQAEVQALWSHAIDPWFDLQAGIRYDARTGPERAHAVLGVQGLAPYWWEVEAAVFVSHEGDVTARAEAEHDIRITQSLILQPRGDLELSLQGVPELGLGTGVTSAGVGARLRYQFAPAFSPYVGIEYDRAFGETARLRRERGEGAGGWFVLMGVRTWF